MKKFMTMVMVGMMVFSLAACGTNGGKNTDTEETNTVITGKDENTWGPDLEEDTSDSVEIPAPNTEYDTMEEAKNAAGFDLMVPDSLDGYPEKVISVYEMDVNMIQISYNNEDQSVIIRKEAKKDEGAHDISGVYIDYESSSSVDQDDLNITFKGNGDQVNVINWASSDYNYSIFTDAGMTQEDALALVAQIQ